MKLVNKILVIILTFFLSMPFLQGVSFAKNLNINSQNIIDTESKKLLKDNLTANDEYLFFMQEYLYLHINLFDSQDDAIKKFKSETNIQCEDQEKLIFWFFTNSNYGLTNETEAFAELFEFYIDGYITKQYTLFWNVLDDFFIKVTPKFIENNNKEEDDGNKLLLDETLNKNEYHFIDWNNNDNFSFISYPERTRDWVEWSGYTTLVLKKFNFDKTPSSKTTKEFFEYFAKFYYIIGDQKTNLESIKELSYTSFDEMDKKFKDETKFKDEYSGLMLKELIDNIVNIYNKNQKKKVILIPNKKKCFIIQWR